MSYAHIKSESYKRRYWYSWRLKIIFCIENISVRIKTFTHRAKFVMSNREKHEIVDKLGPLELHDARDIVVVHDQLF